MIDGWSDHGPTSFTAPRTVTAGNHALAVEYYEKYGDAGITFSTRRAGVPGSPATGPELVANGARWAEGHRRPTA